ncbi:DNA-methyltransferase [Promicromonospora thailandica]|uniref:Methyltransferase n=1 Tax=Promicromonospora thailandica TaxID=765201 RepID=A0A9X2JWD0_9MICO|nr:site-specific DNA-methyltransferase [Promicromonospora thailandica]MCP2265008.1 site-specific DNA-methyltransferase (cytosine-N4-specific) [Promicromonospora thailandica]BFF18705.1 site-specific DNA-methyltransferase [Promicromonospora thailandica]
MTPYYTDDAVTLYHGDAAATLAHLEPGSVSCIVTSPPYFGLRDYGVDGQLGAEHSPSAYVEALLAVFQQARRVLTEDGTLWLNLGDAYSSGTSGQSNLTELTGGGQKADSSKTSRARVDSLPSKNLLGLPWRLAFALQDDGWVLRNDVIWSKPNAMPTSVTDRLGNRHEHLFLLSKAQRYWFDLDAIRQPYDGDRAPSRRARSGHANKPNTIARPWGGIKQPQPNMEATGTAHTAAHERGRNPGDVWTIATQPFPGAHFATMPPALARRCVLAGCKPGGTVLDPFSEPHRFARTYAS